MKRTQLQLDESTYQLLRAMAYQRGMSMSALVRRILREHLGDESPRSLKVQEFSFIASGRSQPSEFDPISERHDDALAEDFSN